MINGGNQHLKRAHIIMSNPGSLVCHSRHATYLAVELWAEFGCGAVHLVAAQHELAASNWAPFFFAMKFVAEDAHAAWTTLEFLNKNAFNWLGLISRKPITEDYVPLLPWLGVMCWGMAAGAWALRRRPHWLALDIGAAGRPLAGLGRWSLGYYLLHQPVLIGLLMAASALR